MPEEKDFATPSDAFALGLAWFLFGEEGREVVEQRARNFIGHMQAVNSPSPWPDFAADASSIVRAHEPHLDGQDSEV